MEARLLYIRERELNEDLCNLLNSADSAGHKFYILVELDPVGTNAMPMIRDLKEIRLRKVKEKITAWFKNCIPEEMLGELIVFEGKPSPVNPPIILKEIQRLKVFVNKENTLRIIPFLKSQLRSDQITFYPITRLSEGKLP